MRKNPGALRGLELERSPGDLLDPEALAEWVANVHLVFHSATLHSISGGRDEEIERITVGGKRRVADARLASGRLDRRLGQGATGETRLRGTRSPSRPRAGGAQPVRPANRLPASALRERTCAPQGPIERREGPAELRPARAQISMTRLVPLLFRFSSRLNRIDRLAGRSGRVPGNRNAGLDHTKENDMGDKGGKKDKAKNDKQKKQSGQDKKKDKKK